MKDLSAFRIKEDKKKISSFKQVGRQHLQPWSDGSSVLMPAAYTMAVRELLHRRLPPARDAVGLRGCSPIVHARLSWALIPRDGEDIVRVSLREGFPKPLITCGSYF